MHDCTQLVASMMNETVPSKLCCLHGGQCRTAALSKNVAGHIFPCYSFTFVTSLHACMWLSHLFTELTNLPRSTACIQEWQLWNVVRSMGIIHVSKPGFIGMHCYLCKGSTATPKGSPLHPHAL